MSWSVTIRPRAEDDIAQARQWYEERQNGLGTRFIQEVIRAIDTLEADADRFPIYYKSFRRILLPRFPYKLFYLIEGNKVIVFRILHAKRKHQAFFPRSQT